MTWSLLARDADGAFGVAIASRFFAVGVLCPRARSGVGALSTQALVNPLYAEPGLALLAQGTPPSEVVRLLTQQDAGREHRQLHLIDSFLNPTEFAQNSSTPGVIMHLSTLYFVGFLLHYARIL